MENIYEKIVAIKNKPLFKNKISKESHKIFYKYTSDKYFKYIYELLYSLCKKVIMKIVLRYFILVYILFLKFYINVKIFLI